MRRSSCGSWRVRRVDSSTQTYFNASVHLSPLCWADIFRTDDGASTQIHKVVMYISCWVGPLCSPYSSQAWMKHSYRRPYLHIKRISQLNLVEEMTASVSCLGAAVAMAFSDGWLFDTELQSQAVFFWGSWKYLLRSWELRMRELLLGNNRKAFPGN